MNDENNAGSTPPMRNLTEPPVQSSAPRESASQWLWEKVVNGLTAGFAPVQSLWTARTLWLVLGVIVLGLVIGWRDVRYFALASVWTVFGIVVAFHARRFLVPDVKLSELYDLSKSGNLAAAVLACGVLATQIAIVFVLAIALLYRPASVS